MIHNMPFSPYIDIDSGAWLFVSVVISTEIRDHPTCTDGYRQSIYADTSTRTKIYKSGGARFYQINYFAVKQAPSWYTGDYLFSLAA